ncbi:Protein kinase domain containing protein [Coccidioides posadasii C735 delta SOWgp]|uniref:Protein kinase domain containing protein n=1 Tax=Coccidioides posadasii (strain C735) TaxID=222929 RepID=C5PEC8_COCP7|nr:Protein kinase domain containing protein [Coccidioides posadasii C735 delta SOWgp]EER24756.1 Protein kinase domain containing protein [Coccidioides posadasii C735 delta SOWgp]|eukprot:XP_003066901.1 Protein kinase domain containing protein [Coccidioides posadasii C735 delta SOWgp]
MPPPRFKAESQLQKEKLVNSYNELLEEFSSRDLRNVGNYSLGKLIGKGSFGKVYLASHKLTNGSKVVLKSSSRDDANLAREIHHHRQFIHPHIARLYEVVVTEKLVWLVLEYCPGDELYNYLLRNGPMPIEKVQKIFTQLVGAVAYVHSKSCVHRDLKLENILLDKHENVKLCDFGFTREYEGKASYLQTFCGTICYSAPEMLKGEKYAGEKVDVWSLGIILFALISGELPFDEDDDQATKKRILSEDPKYNARFSEDAKSLINLLLSKRPLIRPTLSDILAHPFLAEHAPQQQAILKLSRPPAFSTALEKTTLERMRSAGVNTDQVIENVLAQRCDALAGWWALLIEKEERKEKRRERKRREREAEAKNLRRLSAASSRLERISAALVEVDEENHSSEPPRSRGRANRRSLPTPYPSLAQLLIPDLPKLPEGGIAVSPCESIPPPPIEKDGSVRSLSSSRTRPIPPPKERRVSRGSTLHLSASQPELMRPHGILKRPGTRRRQYPILSQLASLKHWLVESTKRAKSPHPKGFGHSSVSLKFLSDRSGPGKNKNASKQQIATPTASSNFSQTQHTPQTKRSSNASSLAPSNASYPGAVRPLSITQPPRPLNSSSSRHRNSLSPAPLTPRNSYRRSSAGLRGRKSTSSSVSSIRTIHHAHSHSKTSSISSNSIDTASTPTGSSIKALGISRSPHTSIKVLPTTPSASTRFPHNIRLVRGSHNAGAGHLHSAFNESAPAPIMSSPSSGLVFARRKRSAFKGPTLNTANLMASGGAGTPLLPRRREALFDAPSAEAPALGPRKSQIIEEEEELFEGHNFEDEEVEEVEGFSPVDEKSPTFIQGRTSLDILASQPIAASSTDALTNNPSALSPVDRSTKSPEPQLLPAAEIEEPSQYPPFHPSGAQSDSEPIRPPRSSSLREHNKPGSTGSNAALERFESAEKPDVVQEERGTESLSPKQT